MKAIPLSEWRWLGMPAHFICGHRCRFHLATVVGRVLVSSVGAMPPVGKDWGEWQEVGSGRMCETMVFMAGKPCAQADCRCGVPEIDGDSLDFGAYNDPGSAQEGHAAMCARWASAQFQAKAAEYAKRKAKAKAAEAEAERLRDEISEALS